VFLCLAALYESWSIPFAVILVVPLGRRCTLRAASRAASTAHARRRVAVTR
jgi:multidrug efflux pump subunit AcrB